ncbi:MAG: sensor histidine kinase [Nevskia sp.]|nr:sensor histidine kinase [Nevskia sp.]
MARASPGLRGRLLRLLLTPLLALFGVSGFASYAVALHYANSVYDGWLYDSANSLSLLVERDERGKLSLDLPQPAERLFEWDVADTTYYQVAGTASGLVAGRADLPPQPPGFEQYRNAHLYDGVIGGHPVRIAALDLPASQLGETVTVQVAETKSKRRAMAHQILFGILVPQLLLIAAAAAAIWFGIQLGLAPLADVAARLDGPESPHAPGGAPGWSGVLQRVVGDPMFGAALVVVALGLIVVLRGRINMQFSLLFLTAVIASAWLGGRMLGWLMAILCTLAFEYFFTHPYNSFILERGEAPYVAAFMVSMIAGNWFGIWRKNMDLALRGAREELESRIQTGSIKLETAQRRFVADAAHQLRTPLTALKLNIDEAMKESEVESMRQMLGQASLAADRVVRLSNQLLLLARTEPSALAEVPFEPFDLAALAREVGADWVPRALQKNIDLTLQAPERRVELSGSRVLVAEVFNNLLENAIKYHPGGGRIAIVLPAQANPGFVISDDGPGIPAAQRQSVLKRFNRGERSSADGSGLGLAIVHEIVKAHGGSLSLGDGLDGHGCSVRVDFPAAG